MTDQTHVLARTAAPVLIRPWTTRLVLAQFAVIFGLLGIIAYQAIESTTVRPTVVVMDPTTGRPTVYRSDTWTPARIDLEHFLGQFTIKHLRRQTATVRQDYADSLFFLAPPLASPLMRPGGVVDQFLRDPGANEVDVQVAYVHVWDTSGTPYKASVSFSRTTYAGRSRSVLSTTSEVAEVVFVRVPEIPPSFVGTNPLGLQITDLRMYPAFGEGRPRS